MAYSPDRRSLVKLALGAPFAMPSAGQKQTPIQDGRPRPVLEAFCNSGCGHCSHTRRCYCDGAIHSAAKDSPAQPGPGFRSEAGGQPGTAGEGAAYFRCKGAARSGGESGARAKTTRRHRSNSSGGAQGPAKRPQHNSRYGSGAGTSGAGRERRREAGQVRFPRAEQLFCAPGDGGGAGMEVRPTGAGWAKPGQGMAAALRISPRLNSRCAHPRPRLKGAARSVVGLGSFSA